MKDFDRDEYPLYKPGHSTSTLLISMFLAFTVGFLVCHGIYAGLDRSLNMNYTNLEVKP